VNACRRDRIEIRHPVQVLTEGNDFRNVEKALLEKLGRSGTDVHDFGGVSELSRFLAAFRRVPGFPSVVSIGIVRDAERSAESALRSVRSACSKAGIPKPRIANQARERESGLSVSVFLFPDGEKPGMLETLLWETIKDSREAACVEEFLNCAEKKPPAVSCPAPTSHASTLGSLLERGPKYLWG